MLVMTEPSKSPPIIVSVLTISEMEPGQSGYTYPWAIQAGRLHQHAPVFTEPYGKATARIVRRDYDYMIYQSDVQ